MIDLARANPAFRPVIERALIGEPEAILLVEFAGDDRAAAARAARAAGRADGRSRTAGQRRGDRTGAGAQKALWEVRKAGLNIMMSMKGDGKPVSFIEDCAVPLEHLAEYTDRLTEVFEKHGTRGTWYAHASVGTLHVRPDARHAATNGRAKMRAIAEEASAMVREYKGAYSGEHGDGLVPRRVDGLAIRPAARRTRSARSRRCSIRDGRMNPGKIVAPPRMDDASLFRFKPAIRQESRSSPRLDWSAWNVERDPATGVEGAPGTGSDVTRGLAKAVEMCNNNGHCRKFDAGVMCPSYRVTRDEQHTTRGRANTLRLALSGQLGAEASPRDAVHAALICACRARPAAANARPASTWRR